MEPKFQTSFIPKKTIDNDSRNRVVAISDTNIFTLAASIIFIVTLLLYGGLYFYRDYVIEQVKKADTALTEAEAAIEPKKIKEIISNNSRINNSLKILDGHLATSKLMLFLQDSALKKVKFSEFTYQNKDGVPSIVINSEVQTYNSFAYQQKVLVENEYIQNSGFSDILLGDNGNIKYKFSGRIESSLVSYKKSLETLTTN